MSTVRNRPEPLGQALGQQLARFADQEKELFPPRCASCAFRAGTFPNGCLTTTANAMKCVIEREPFYCHEHRAVDGTPTQLCRGWAMLAKGPEIATAPWPFIDGADKPKTRGAQPK